VRADKVEGSIQLLDSASTIEPMELLEVQDVARTLNCGTQTVRRLCDEGTLPAFAVTPRGQRLFAADVVERTKALRNKQRRSRGRRG
jgi:excisionase family DNA binding protein